MIKVISIEKEQIDVTTYDDLLRGEKKYINGFTECEFIATGHNWSINGTASFRMESPDSLYDAEQMLKEIFKEGV